MSFLIRESIDVKPNSDFLFRNHGSICLLQPLTPAAEEWIGDNVAINDETQFWGSAIVIEPRYVEDILTGIAGDGLVISSHSDSIN